MRAIARARARATFFYQTPRTFNTHGFAVTLLEIASIKDRFEDHARRRVASQDRL